MPLTIPWHVGNGELCWTRGKDQQHAYRLLGVVRGLPSLLSVLSPKHWPQTFDSTWADVDTSQVRPTEGRNENNPRSPCLAPSLWRY